MGSHMRLEIISSRECFGAHCTLMLPPRVGFSVINRSNGRHRCGLIRYIGRVDSGLSQGSIVGKLSIVVG